MSDRWQRLLADFETAVALPPHERDELLARRRREDPDAADELARLLAADVRAGVLDTSAERLLGGVEPTAMVPPTFARPPSDTLSTAVGDRLPPAARVGRYEVQGRIGRGGFGDVYRAFDPVLKRAVALKTCLFDDDGARARFVREAELAARLVHPNIVTVHDFGVDAGTPFLVQELLAGEDLSQWLARRPAPPLAARLRLLRGIAAGLAHAHAAGVVHRDVKPGNVRVLPDGVKILDFGIARDAAAASSLTGSERALGTLAYMAPEQARGEGAGPRADVHAFGAVAYEVLSGVRAVPGASPAALLYGLLEREPRPLREAAPRCPPELAALVDRCLAREPARRFADGRELLAALQPIVDRHAPSGGDDEEGAGAVGPRRALRPLAAMVLGAAALAVAAMLAWPLVRARMATRSAEGERVAMARAEADGARARPVVVREAPRAGASPAPTSRRATNAATTSIEVPGPPGVGAGLAPAREGMAPPPPAIARASPSLGPPAPQRTTAPAALGTVEIDASPWGELVRLTDAGGRELDLPRDAITPLALALPAGDYVATLRQPGGEARSCTVTVSAGARARCRVSVATRRAADYLPEDAP